MLQGGDCAESFGDFTANVIRDTFRVLLQMAVVLTFGGSVPVVKIGRMAGQFAKPRSSDTETQGGETLPSYRGDIVNGPDFTAGGAHARPGADGVRLFPVGRHAEPAARLRHRRLRRPARGASLEPRLRRPLAAGARYQDLASRIDETLAFMQACGMTLTQPQVRETDFYTSHEALLLPYEQALTRVDSTTGDTYACSAHFLWIGDRTRQPDGAHVEFLRGVKNPIGMKVGPSMDAGRPAAPHRPAEPGQRDGPPDADLPHGRRQGRGQKLPPLLRAVKRAGRKVVWLCDPMHGNTITTAAKAQDPQLRRDPDRGSPLLRRPCRGRAPSPAACMSR